MLLLVEYGRSSKQPPVTSYAHSAPFHVVWLSLSTASMESSPMHVNPTTQSVKHFDMRLLLCFLIEQLDAENLVCSST
eukprot:3385332-Amphidinium_carterae.2